MRCLPLRITTPTLIGSLFVAACTQGAKRSKEEAAKLVNGDGDTPWLVPPRVWAACGQAGYEAGRPGQQAQKRLAACQFVVLDAKVACASNPPQKEYAEHCTTCQHG
ncbi:uncharacterized protein LY79DRAFT_223566 [Colletotrichum navitas]|uniref:Lipoprotein n=1 Tax=Colletotrichum navitas TaxID=681940 RepID=A0AAD8V5B2_9PEZI|nr:uncharacterized protein LY79DRAFT_223566 [Colletotrichum navitas]KAK1590164.1 hypothetical protein LY79DRAFT_223566 [Colletotrichum navitas]